MQPLDVNGHVLNVGDRVKWCYSEPSATEAELNGKITAVGDDNDVMVRWDDGLEEGCLGCDVEKVKVEN